MCGVVGADRVQPLDRLVRDVVGEVVQLPVLALGHAEDRVVLGDDRVVLAGRAGQEAPPVVEAPGLRPVLERPRGTHLAPGRHVPLAEAAGDVPVLLEDPGQGRAAARPRPRVARERARELGDATHAHAVVVAPGEQRGARRRADRRDVEAVVGQARLLDARQVRRPDLAAERVGAAEAGVVDEHDAGRSGRRRAASGRGSSTSRPRTCPSSVRSRRRRCGPGSAARSGPG